MLRILPANERFSYRSKGYNPATHNGGNSSELCLYVETNVNSKNFGKLYKQHTSVDGVLRVYTKDSYSDLADFWKKEMNGHMRLYVSDLGYILVPSIVYDDTDSSDKTAIAQLDTPLSWDHQDDKDSELTDGDIGTSYYGILYGTAYVLSRQMGKIRYSDYCEKEISTKSLTGSKIKQGAKIAGRTHGGKIYVKDNGIIWGVLGISLQEEAPIFLGKLGKIGTKWAEWF